MSQVIIAGDTSGTITLQAPAVSGSTTLTLPATTATLATLTTPSFASTIGVGGATASASGSGISFPATQSASSDANTLDDYEEGTWTPTLAFGGGSTGITYDNQRAVYTKVGNIVFISCYVSITNKGSSTGFVTINGLPFTSLNSTNLYNNVAIWGNNLTGIAGSLQGYCGPNSTSIGEIEYLGVGTQTILTNSNFGSTSGIMVNFSYSIN